MICKSVLWISPPPKKKASEFRFRTADTSMWHSQGEGGCETARHSAWLCDWFSHCPYRPSVESASVELQYKKHGVASGGLSQWLGSGLGHCFWSLESTDKFLSHICAHVCYCEVVVTVLTSCTNLLPKLIKKDTSFICPKASNYKYHTLYSLQFWVW